MADRIDNLTPTTSSPVRDSAKVRTTDTASTGQPVEAAEPVNTVQLTDAARAIQELEQSLSSVEAVDTARVEGLRQTLANGEYRVDVDRVAARLLAAEAVLPRSE